MSWALAAEEGREGGGETHKIRLLLFLYGTGVEGKPRQPPKTSRADLEIVLITIALTRSEESGSVRTLFSHDCIIATFIWRAHNSEMHDCTPIFPHIKVKKNFFCSIFPGIFLLQSRFHFDVLSELGRFFPSFPPT